MENNSPTPSTEQNPEEFRNLIQARIESLSYLPTTAAVAMKFVELGKDPDAEPSDYAKVISADSSLSSKLLALANSSWAGVRNRVTTVKSAVNLLGLGTVRTLAVSYCMTGLHNELRLTPAESETFWEASLCKAVTAKQCALAAGNKLADEAFVGGLFQDFALAVMYSVARERYLALLQDGETEIGLRLQQERALCGMDHAEVGRALAQKLELPEVFVDMVAFHHNRATLEECIENPTLAEATYIAGLLPHLLNRWNRSDAQTLGSCLQQRQNPESLENFIALVQTEFEKLYTFFNEGQTPQTNLGDLLIQTARETADNTTELVGRMNQMVRQAATTVGQNNTP